MKDTAVKKRPKERIYNAIVKRTIVDELQIQIKVVGNMSTIDMEHQIEKLAQKPDIVDPMMTNARISTEVLYMDLVEESDDPDDDNGV